ncbi:MAG: class D sortase [bacterium]
MRKFISILLITAGVLVFLYPLYTRVHSWYWQQRLLAAWEEETARREDPVESPAVEEEEGDFSPDPAWADLPLLGIITIEKIDARLPILPDTREKYLRVGVGHLPETALPGEPGNCVLTGHRGYTRGRLFNRLDEVEIGDDIVIETREGKYTYRVSDVFIVEPGDPAIMEYEEGEEVVTLVTCHPLYVASHRLIVRGTLLREKPK